MFPHLETVLFPEPKIIILIIGLPCVRIAKAVGFQPVPDPKRAVNGAGNALHPQIPDNSKSRVKQQPCGSVVVLALEIAQISGVILRVDGDHAPAHSPPVLVDQYGSGRKIMTQGMPALQDGPFLLLILHHFMPGIDSFRQIQKLLNILFAAPSENNCVKTHLKRPPCSSALVPPPPFPAPGALLSCLPRPRIRSGFHPFPPLCDRESQWKSDCALPLRPPPARTFGAVPSAGRFPLQSPRRSMFFRKVSSAGFPRPQGGKGCPSNV